MSRTSKHPFCFVLAASWTCAAVAQDATSDQRIPLGDHASLALDAEARARFEHYRGNEFGDAVVPDEGYELYRILPSADLEVGSYLHAFVQLGLTDANRDDRSVGPVDDTGNEILQGFVELSFPGPGGTTVGAGRKVMSLGSERLVSARYGPNVLRSFDGAWVNWHNPHLRVDTFFLHPVRNNGGSFNDDSEGSRRLWGIYGTWSDPGDDSGLDVYYLGLSSREALYNQGTGPETRNTVGLRYFGESADWTWDLEGFYQFGNFAGGRVRAWSIATDTGYTFRYAPLRPRLGIKANVISGDRNPDNTELQTFSALFPKGKYFGESGLIGPSNLINLHPSLTLDLGNGWSLGTAAVFYWRESLHDGIYDPAGNLLRPDGDSRSRYIGTQGDVVLGWEFSRQLSFEAGYSVFRPGTFIRDTGRAETVHFVGLEALWRY